jgi:hypothetical protein
MAVTPLQLRYIKHTKRFYIMQHGRFETLEAIYKSLPFLNKGILKINIIRLIIDKFRHIRQIGRTVVVVLP